MIRQQNKGKYICIILFSVLEILTLIGAYLAHYFTKTRMGMLRHIVYLNGKWEKTFPISTIKLVTICIIIALIILVFLNYFKRQKAHRVNIWTIMWTMVISGWTIYFLLTYSTEINRVYYILSVCFILTTLLQNTIYYFSSLIKLKNSIE